MRPIVDLESGKEWVDEHPDYNIEDNNCNTYVQHLIQTL